MHVDGVVRSCSLPISAVSGKVVTIEGLSADSSHPVQVAWLKHQVSQCGHCHSGQIMAAVALPSEQPAPTDADIDEVMTNICGCRTYGRIRAAIHDAANDLPPLSPPIRSARSTKHGIGSAAGERLERDDISSVIA